METEVWIRYEDVWSELQLLNPNTDPRGSAMATFWLSPAGTFVSQRVNWYPLVSYVFLYFAVDAAWSIMILVKGRCRRETMRDLLLWFVLLTKLLITTYPDSCSKVKMQLWGLSPWWVDVMLQFKKSGKWNTHQQTLMLLFDFVVSTCFVLVWCLEEVEMPNLSFYYCTYFWFLSQIPGLAIPSLGLCGSHSDWHSDWTTQFAIVCDRIMRIFAAIDDIDGNNMQ